MAGGTGEASTAGRGVGELSAGVAAINSGCATSASAGSFIGVVPLPASESPEDRERPMRKATRAMTASTATPITISKIHGKLLEPSSATMMASKLSFSPASMRKLVSDV